MFGRKKTTVPEWASVMDEKRYSAFISAIDDYFKRRGEPYTIDDGTVNVGSWKFGLTNIVQICAAQDPKEYPEMVEHHFALMVENEAFEASLVPDDFEKIKQYIGVRLYGEDYISRFGEDIMIRRPFAEDVFAALIFDFPQTIKNISRSDADKWNISDNELFDIGIENIRRNYQLQAQEVVLGGDTVFTIETEHFFASNILFDIERNKRFIGKGGAIIGIPTRSLAAIYPINDMKVVNVLSAFFDFVPRFYAGGPGSLTWQIFWYRDGRYEPLKYETGKKIKFTPSEAFLSLLNGGLE
ncbi:MAG: hypothetical protein FWC29_02985 [Methanomassiliicoccaceae archaeon]|nr:hypothetical protein [Methanomassiliicoccaceae archaeon]